MVSTEAFQDWMERVQAGEPLAVAEFVRLYEPMIRQEIRLRLINLRLLRVLDATDICQSVLTNFFVRAAAEPFQCENPKRLKALLLTMARNKIQDEVRKQQTTRRDHRRVDTTFAESALGTIMADEPTPSKIVAGQELLEEIQRRFTREERELLQERLLGRDWNTIASARTAHAETLRKRLNRAILRVVRELGLEDELLL